MSDPVTTISESPLPLVCAGQKLSDLPETREEVIDHNTVCLMEKLAHSKRDEAGNASFEMISHYSCSRDAASGQCIPALHGDMILYRQTLQCTVTDHTNDVRRHDGYYIKVLDFQCDTKTSQMGEEAMKHSLEIYTVALMYALAGESATVPASTPAVFSSDFRVKYKTMALAE